MSRERREWYEEDFDPSPHPSQGTFKWSFLSNPQRRGRTIQIIQDGRNLQVGQILNGPDGKPAGIVQSAGTHEQSGIIDVMVFGGLEASSQKFKDRMKALGMSLQSLPSSLDIPPYETARERALRLKQQPHSMAQDPNDFHFDHHGRRRRK